MRGAAEAGGFPLFFGRAARNLGSVKRLSKAILILAALLVMVMAGAIYAVNRYVQTPAARLRIQTALSDALGVPMEITGASFGWSGLQLAGVRVPHGERNFLEASSFRAEYRLLPLLQRRLVLRRMTLENPRVLWAQNSQGKWELPLLPKKGRKDKLANAQTAEPHDRGFTVVLDRLAVVNGTVELLDAEGKRVLIASELTMDYSLRDPQAIEGTLVARQIAWGNFLTFSEVRTPLKYAGGELALSDLHAAVAGGHVQGSLTVRTDDQQAPFALQLKLDRVDLARLVTEAGWPPDQASGALGGTVEWHGSFRDLEHTVAKGQLTIADGHFQQFNLFQTIGQILQIPQLEDLRARTGAANFVFADEQTTIDHLILDTGDLSFSTKGTVKTSGEMNLQARLAVSEKIAQQLPAFVRANFRTPDAQQRYGIDFDITGKTDKPKTNLLNRVIGAQVGGQLNDLLGSVFNGADRKKDDAEKDRKKKEHELERAREKEAKRAAAAAAAGLPVPPPAAPANPATEPRTP